MTRRESVLADYAMMIGIYRAMPEDERAKLYAWEAENIDGATIGSRDWPGWGRYIQDRPVFDLEKSKHSISKISRRIRNRILKRDGYRCQHCWDTADLTIDHIVPSSRGGSDEETNLQVLCRSCNASKGNRV